MVSTSVDWDVPNYGENALAFTLRCCSNTFLCLLHWRLCERDMDLHGRQGDKATKPTLLEARVLCSTHHCQCSNYARPASQTSETAQHLIYLHLSRYKKLCTVFNQVLGDPFLSTFGHGSLPNRYQLVQICICIHDHSNSLRQLWQAWKACIRIWLQGCSHLVNWISKSWEGCNWLCTESASILEGEWNPMRDFEPSNKRRELQWTLSISSGLQFQTFFGKHFQSVCFRLHDLQPKHGIRKAWQNHSHIRHKTLVAMNHPNNNI